MIDSDLDKNKPEIIYSYLKLNGIYNFKRSIIEEREVKVIQIDFKRKRAEVIIGNYNPFWVNMNELKTI